MQESELTKIISLVSVYWPHAGLPSTPSEIRFLRDAWMRLLGDLDAAAVVAAVEMLAAEGDRFAPPPGLIRKRAVILSITDGGAPGPEEAWAEIKAKIGSVGYTSGLDLCDVCVSLDQDGRQECEHRWVTFTHPAIQAFVDALGWKYLCESQDEMADRAHFVKWYPAAVDRLSNNAALPESVRMLVSGVASALPLAEAT